MNLQRESFVRYLLQPLIALTLVIAVSACGDQEAEQRQHFADFLQDSILSQPTVVVPQLTAQQKEAFGHYSADYAIISDFHQQMNTRVSEPMHSALDLLHNIGSIPMLLDQRDELHKFALAMTETEKKLRQLRKEADARHAALQQPDDLKALYDQVYDKSVTQPATAGAKLFTQLPIVLNLMVEQADLIKAQGDAAKVAGNRVEFTDQAALDQYNVIQQKLALAAKQLLDISTQAQKLIQ